MRVFGSHLRPVRWMLAGGLLASVGAAAMQWVAPWPLKFVFDSVLGRKPLPAWLSWLPGSRIGLLSAMVAALLITAAGLGLADYLSNRLVATAGQRVVFEIRCRLFRHLEAQSLAFHQRRQTGDLLARLGGDIQAIQSAMVTAVPTLVRNGLTLAGMAAIMSLIDWRYALLAVLPLPGLFWLSRRYLHRIRALQRRARAADGQAGAVAQEVLTSMTVVQAFGAEAIESERFEQATREGLEENRRAVVAQSEFTPLMTAGMTISAALVVFVGARAVVLGQLTAGDLVVFMAYVRGMYNPVRQLAKLAGVVTRAQAAAERVAEMLQTAEAIPERPDARRVARAQGTISLRGVAFSYPDGPTVLNGIDLEIPAGAHYALVGATGSGKSTLLRLVPRFMDATAGSVRLDSVDVRDLNLADLRRQIGFIPQEPYLFRGSVWENILYGSAVRDRAAAIEAARAAGVHEVIESLPQGYDFSVAERGASLSGGQRQCVAVARAMARNAPVLLLDEPTVGLDAELESVLLAALHRLSDGRTTVTISHQLWGLRHVDRIAVLVDGRIAEAGTHDELLKTRQTYWRMQRLQQSEVSPAVVDGAGRHRVRGRTW